MAKHFWTNNSRKHPDWTGENPIIVGHWLKPTGRQKVRKPGCYSYRGQPLVDESKGQRMDLRYK